MAKNSSPESHDAASPEPAPLDAALGPSPAAALALAIAALAATTVGILVLTPRARWAHFLFYDVPIAVPFVFFLCERWRGRASWQGARRLLDVGVLSIALMRPAAMALGQGTFPPLVSGHALFLSYAILATHSPLVRASAIAVMLQVIYVKVFVWADPSIVGGAVLGILAAAAHRPRGREDVQ